MRSRVSARGGRCQGNEKRAFSHLDDPSDRDMPKAKDDNGDDRIPKTRPEDGRMIIEKIKLTIAELDFLRFRREQTKTAIRSMGVPREMMQVETPEQKESCARILAVLREKGKADASN